MDKYRSIMGKPEAHRNKWALGLSVIFTFLIFVSFAFYKGFITFGGGFAAPKNQTANVISTNFVPSPIESTKETFGTAFDDIKQQYEQFTNSVSNVLVPFFTGIDVYSRK